MQLQEFQGVVLRLNESGSRWIDSLCAVAGAGVQGSVTAQAGNREDVVQVAGGRTAGNGAAELMSFPAAITNSMPEFFMVRQSVRSFCDVPRLRLQMDAPLASAYRIALTMDAVVPLPSLSPVPSAP